MMTMTWPEIRLSPTQERLLELLAQGYTTMAAAAALHTTRAAVYNQCDEIKAGLGVPTMAAAVAVCIQSGTIRGPRPEDVVWRQQPAQRGRRG